MHTKLTAIGFVIASALILAMGVFAGGCKHCVSSVNDFQLDYRMTGADSPEDIENMIKASLAQKYAHEDTTDSYKMYGVTNGMTRWLFVRAYNAPRSIGAFNLYCYAQEKPGDWLLRAYVPVIEPYYTNSFDHNLTFKMDNDYTEVVFRGEVIFTGASRKK